MPGHLSLISNQDRQSLLDREPHSTSADQRLIVPRQWRLPLRIERTAEQGKEVVGHGDSVSGLRTANGEESQKPGEDFPPRETVATAFSLPLSSLRSVRGSS